MPTAAKHACPSPGCPELTTGGPCRAHARGNAAARGYGYRWALFSQAWLHEYPWCGMRVDGRCHVDDSRCAQQGRRTLARVTDHIVALRAGGAHMDRENSQSLCVGCNVAKGLREQEGGHDKG